ncbi:hypothetical protein TcasGA2_TC002081 [Tribolium castaneum]|uniref:Uncharacterized protein n=1 Tax=Tribolium castaneum TaxID=7070 RepID=D7EIU0_TRICA|nr:hypothetical protein TcasGA2_TC002081 [Tribolium castaneum]
MTSVLLLCTLITPILANGFYHQEYNYQTSSSSYKNHELQHHNEDEGFYSKDGDLEGRFRPRVNAHSQHSEYVNPKMQHGYRIGTDRTSSFGQLHAQNRYRMNEPFEGGAYGMVTPVHDYGISSNLRQVTANLQREMEAELQRAVYDHAQRAMAYGGITQAQIDTDRRVLEEELRRNVTMRLQEALKMQYGNQGIRGAYSYSIQNGRLQPTANYNNQELADLTRQLEEELIRHLDQQVQTYYRTEVHTHTQRNTYRVNGGEYPGALQARPPVYHQPYPPPHPNPVLAKPDSITTVATRVQTELNEILNKILEDTQKRYFAENSYQNPSINYDAILAHLQDELRANITFHFDDQIKRAYGYSNYASKYSVEDIENLRRQIEANLITKLNRDFNRQRERFFHTHQPMYQPIPANHVYYPVNQVHQVDVANLQRQMQEQLSRQLQEALMRQSYSQAMYSGHSGFNSQAHYQRALEQLSAELNRNLTRQMEQLNAQQYQIGVHDAQLATMRNQLQHDLMRQLQQGLQQSYSQYSSWSSSSRSSSNSHNYRPVRGFDANLYRQYGTSSDLVGEDCMMGDDPGVKRTRRGALTQENDDLTQQTEDLTQQSQEIAQDEGQTEDLTQQTEDLTQQSQDMTQQTEDLTQQSQDMTQQTEDLTQQVQSEDSSGKPIRSKDVFWPLSQDLTQQSQDLTQQSQDLTQQSQDLTQQLQTQNDLEKPQRAEDVFESQSQDLTQQTQDLTQPGKPKYQVQIGPAVSQEPTPHYHAEYFRPSQDLTQQSQDLTQPKYHSQIGPAVSQEPTPHYHAEYYRPSQYLTQQSQDLTQQTQPGEPRYYSQLGPAVSQEPTPHYHAEYFRPSQDLTQQSQDLTQPGKPMYQSQMGPAVSHEPTPNYHAEYYRPSQYLTQQNQDLTQQTQDLTQPGKPIYISQNGPSVSQEPITRYYSKYNPVAIDPVPQYQDYMRPSQDLTQPKLYSQTGPGVYQKRGPIVYHQLDNVAPSQDLTQQSQDLTQPKSYSQIGPTVYRKPSPIVYQEAEYDPTNQDLTQQSQSMIGPPVESPTPKPIYAENIRLHSQDLTQPIDQQKPTDTNMKYVVYDPTFYDSHQTPKRQYLTQQSQDLTQQTQDIQASKPYQSMLGSPVESYTPKPTYAEILRQHSQDLTQQSPYQQKPNDTNMKYVMYNPIYYHSRQTPKNNDLTQQSQDLTLNNQGQVDIGPPDSYQQSPVDTEPLQSQDLTQQSQDLTQQSQDLTQQSQDLTQNSEPFNQQQQNDYGSVDPLYTSTYDWRPGKQNFGNSVGQRVNYFESLNKPTSRPPKFDELRFQSENPSQDLTQQSQDLTQQSQDLTQQSQDLTQQTQNLRKPIVGTPDLTQQSQDLTQQSQDLTQQSQDLTQQSQDLSQQSQDLTQQDLTTPPTAQNSQKKLSQAQEESQRLLDLLRRQSQENQNIGPMNYSPKPVYADYGGQQIQVGTTRQLRPNEAPGRKLEPQTAQVDTIPDQETQTVRDIEPVEPQVASEVQQVDDTTGTTTKKPGWWTRFKNKIG